jgi:hypothetical protein
MMYENAINLVSDELPNKSALSSTNKNIYESNVGRDTVQVLADYEGSRFFSADRHYERSYQNESQPSALSMESIQFNNILLVNSDEVTMEARNLLSQWMDGSKVSGGSKESSDGIVKEIIRDLKVESISAINLGRDVLESTNLVIKHFR